jgi:hypothetical protein
MAIAFSTIKDPRINLTDKLTFGKYTNCRVCDILEDNYEYVLWLHSKMNNFAPAVIEECMQFKMNQATSIETDNNAAIVNMNPWGNNNIDDWMDDIPF